MGILNLSKTGAALVLSAQLVVAPQLATVAQAEMIGTDTAISIYQQHSDRGFLLEQMQRDDIRAEIIAQGIDPVEAQARLAALSDAEVATMVQQMQDGAAGADVVTTLFTVFIVLLVTDFLCLTQIYAFTNCAF